MLTQRRTLWRLGDAHLDTLATALYVTADDLIKGVAGPCSGAPLLSLLVDEQDLITTRPGQTLIADKDYFG